MPKAEKGSLKDIGKRIKAKGLQKLKFYCQLCQKQCRDDGGGCKEEENKSFIYIQSTCMPYDHVSSHTYIYACMCQH